MNRSIPRRTLLKTGCVGAIAALTGCLSTALPTPESALSYPILPEDRLRADGWEETDKQEDTQTEAFTIAGQEQSVKTVTHMVTWQKSSPSEPSSDVPEPFSNIQTPQFTSYTAIRAGFEPNVLGIPTDPAEEKLRNTIQQQVDEQIRVLFESYSTTDVRVEDTIPLTIDTGQEVEATLYKGFYSDEDQMNIETSTYTAQIDPIPVYALATYWIQNDSVIVTVGAYTGQVTGTYEFTPDYQEQLPNTIEPSGDFSLTEEDTQTRLEYISTLITQTK